MARARVGNPRPKFNAEIMDVIETVEKKPHAMYIKYLMTKRVGPTMITSEMNRLGLSCPSIQFLNKYYHLQIDPLIKKNGLTSLYAEYKAKLEGKKLNKNKTSTRSDYISGILKYAIDIADDEVLQVKFCSFIRDLGVEIPWGWEITRYHGTVDNFPKDSNGVRILTAQLAKTNIDKVAKSRYRHIVEKLLLDRLSDARISAYMMENCKEDIKPKDVAAFRMVFFNTHLNGLEDNIKMLTDEKTYQLSILADIKNSATPYCDMTIGEKAQTEQNVNRRINEIDNNLRDLRAAYNDLTYDSKAAAENDFQQMFIDVATRAYKRFCDYDNSKDRDIAGPLAQVSKVMIAAHDKVEKIKETSVKASSDDDVGIRGNLASLYHARLDEIEDEEKEKANTRLQSMGFEGVDDNINPDEIGGVDELGSEISDEDNDNTDE